MTSRYVVIAALLACAATAQPASAATMQTIFTGSTTGSSTDMTGFFGIGSETGNVGFWPVEISVIWNTEPPALDPAQTTLNQDSSSFRTQSDMPVPTGVSELNIMFDSSQTNFVNQVTYFQWSRVNDPVTGSSALTFSIGGLLPDAKPFDLTVQYSAIPGALPLARDAAFAVSSDYLLKSTSSFRIMDLDGTFVNDSTFENLAMSTINLDPVIDPPPADVPLPGAAMLLASGLAATAGYRNLRKAG